MNRRKKGLTQLCVINNDKLCKRKIKDVVMNHMTRAQGQKPTGDIVILL